MLHSTSLSSVLDILKLMVPLPGFHIGFWAWDKKNDRVCVAAIEYIMCRVCVGALSIS